MGSYNPVVHRRYASTKKGELNQRRKKLRRAQKSWFLRKVKSELGCPCGEYDWVVLDFHHPDPTQKGLPRFKNLEDMSWDFLLDEIEKCVVRCSNCHRREEHKLRISNFGRSIYEIE